jgi:hypothetical protein
MNLRNMHAAAISGAVTIQDEGPHVDRLFMESAEKSARSARAERER